MYTVLFNYWRRASFFFVLALLLYIYLGLPDSVAFKHNEVGRPIGFIDKQRFFYISAIVIIGLNFVFGLVKSQFAKIDFDKIIKAKEGYIKDVLTGWINAILAFINTYLVFALMGLQNINKDAQQNLDRDYTWFLIIGAVLFMVILFYIPLKLLLSKPSDN
jgi:uncharacterized membrane protein (DUF485 family)